MLPIVYVKDIIALCRTSEEGGHGHKSYTTLVLFSFLFENFIMIGKELLDDGYLSPTAREVRSIS